MTNQESVAQCATDLLVSFPESLHIFSGLLTAVTVCGGISGLLTAALLYVFCLKPMLLTRQGNNARRLFEPNKENVDSNQSDTYSNNRKEVTNATAAHQEKNMPTMNSDVAAFASRAKVVYPINQKYRPLADGASNPSVHERSKLPAASSSSTADSLSQEQDNDDSSQFISSSLVPKSLQNQSFTRVSQYPHTLTQPGFEGRIGLYCLALQDVQQQRYALQEEKCQIFLRMVKMIFGQRFPKDKNQADFFQNILLEQEKELDGLKKKWLAVKTPPEKNEEVDSPCTLEEIERTQKDLLEHGLQMMDGFSQQVELLCQHLLNKGSVLPTEEAQDIIQALIQALLLVENHLISAQEAGLKSIQQRLQWWEELMYLFQAKPALIRQEVSLRQGLVATTLEQLSRDGCLTFDTVEKILSEMQSRLTECLQQCTEESTRKTKELASEKCKKSESKMKKLQSCQAREKNQALDSAQAHGDLHQFAMVYQELLVKHRQQNNSLELQQDDGVVHSLCDLWKKLHSSWSKRLCKVAKNLFLTSIPHQAELSAECCNKHWLDVEEKLVAQLQQAESVTKMQVEDMRAQLDQDRQLWCEETATVLSCLRHLAEQQMKILQTTVVRLSYTLDRQVGMLMEKKQEHLLVAVQRHFVARHFCLHVLREMRLSKLKALTKTDFRVLLREDHNQGQTNTNSATKDLCKGSSPSLAERTLGAESQLVGHSFQQEFLSELETGTELLQSHAQLLLGNTLSHCVWRRMGTLPFNSQPRPQHDDGLKHHLRDVASESVYLTKDSLSALVQSYYTRMEDITTKLQKEQSSIVYRSIKEENARRDCSLQLNQALLRELTNWGRNLTSKQCQQRVEQHKRKLLEQYDLEQEVLFETLRQQRLAQDQAMGRVKTQLLGAEEAFMTEVAALARVSLQGAHSDPSIQENPGVESHDIMNLLILNPALDPALNPSLTPTVVTQAAKPSRKARERESPLI